MRFELHAKVTITVILACSALRASEAVWWTVGCKQDSVQMAVLPRHKLQQCAN